MVRRLNTPEMTDAVTKVWANRVAGIKFIGPADVGFLIKSWARMMEQGFGKAYGSFQHDAPKAFFLGMIVPDLYTGSLCGFEHTWMTEPGGEALDLLRMFEKDCKAAGCGYVVSGLSHLSDVPPEKLRRVYKARGYAPYGEAFYRKI